MSTVYTIRDGKIVREREYLTLGAAGGGLKLPADPPPIRKALTRQSDALSES